MKDPTNNSSLTKATVIGDVIRHIAAESVASCEISAIGFHREDIQINILSPSKVPITYKIEEIDGLFRVEFEPREVGSYIMDVYVAGTKIQDSPLYFKVYDAGLIRVTDVNKGSVGTPCQFRVDASQAGEGQLEISINDGEVPNNVQVLGGGRCLVHFTPEVAKSHTIDIKFNSEPVKGCPFICHITDTSKILVALNHLELMPIHKKANFQIHVDKTANIELAVSVVGPKSDIPVRVTGNVKSGFTAEFVPDEVGTYNINVEYHNKPMGGTPFKAKAYDSSNVLVSPIPWGTIGENLEFTVDASKAGEGNLEITISARGRNIPTQVHPQGSARFAVSFVPLEAVDHVINITFNKDLVPGAPFTAKIHTDPNHIEVSGAAIAATAVGKSSFFTLSNVNGSVEDIEIIIESPTGDHVPALVQDRGGGSFRAEFCPRIAGEHRIYVTFNSEPVPGSPFACKVYNVNAIQVRECQKGIVGKPVTFLVETSQAGPGNLEVTVNNGQVPTSAQAQGNHTYAISFIPKEAKPHIVELKFNSENVPGSPFKCLVVDAAKVNMSGDGLEKVPVHRQATFFIDGPPDVGDPEVKILSPYRKSVLNSIRFLAEGHFAVDYTPTTVGDHQVDVKMADLHVQGSPFTVKAYDASKVEVSNITSGVIGKLVFFSIDASQAGAGNLEIIVSVNGKNVPNFVNSEGNAKFQVKFNPVEAKTHILSVKFNDESVPNSPFECKIRDESNLSLSGSGLKMCPTNFPAEFTIDGGGFDESECAVFVQSPSNVSLPVKVSGNSKILATYHPTEVGPHNIRVLINDREVNDSPFTCNVYDVSKVVVAGLSRKNIVGKPITFTVDASQAGEGTLELVVSTDNSTVRAEVQGRSRGLYDVTFVPLEALSHFVNISFNEESIPNNPFECFVENADPYSSASGVLTDSFSDLVLRGDGLKVASVGTNAVFTVDCKMYQENVTVRIVDPRNDVLPERVTELQTGLLRVTYKAEVVGTHVIRMLDDNFRTVGNPHRVDVFDPKRIRVTKVGTAILGEESKVNVDTSAAGRGALSVIIRAAGQEVRHSIRDLADGRYEILYYPQMAISHKLDIKYNGYPITSGPLEVKVKNPNFGKVVTASGLGLYQARVNGKPSTFTIESLGHSSKEFDITVTGPPDVIPPNEAIPVRCYIQKDGNLMPEFIATTAGVYKIEVLHNRKPIIGSPFNCQSYDPSKVELTNIKDGENIAGEAIRFHVQRRHAGFAELEVVVTSPLGGDLPIEVKGLAGDKTGDLVEFIPEVAGRYKFLIKYGGEEVPGSPLNFAVQETPTYGMGQANYMPKIFGRGLYSGLVNEVVSFQIDTSGFPPGSPDPSIYISGPNTNAKTTIEKDSNGLLVVKFIPMEVGEFSIQIIFNGSETISRIPTYRPKICDVTSLIPSNGWNSHLDYDGFMELTQNVEKILTFDTRKAGPGELESEIKSSHRRLDSRIETEGHKSHVIFTPYDDSEHTIDIKWNGYPIRNIPIIGRVDYKNTIENGFFHSKPECQHI
ncbi:filamin-A [Lepeophtheirus salmonis]|uniref:filamin-A n=1 Tax=Lepeophtheirus salmonis TaxID=72036 RepID=UPI001AEB87E7|nr:filamin-C-like [Lepeophtheirus salmonis]